MRLFAALVLPEQALDALEGWTLGFSGVRRVPRDSLHLTLMFFGEMEPSEAMGLMERAWATVLGEPLEYRLEGTGSFEDRVIWVGGTFSPGVHGLAKALGNRSFRPHITVARVSGGQVPSLAEPPPGLSGLFDGMALVQSTLTPRGALYTTLARWG